MPSERKQINIRLTEQSLARLLALVERMREETGMNLSQSDVLMAGLKELERKYPPPAPTAMQDALTPVQTTERLAGIGRQAEATPAARKPEPTDLEPRPTTGEIPQSKRRKRG
jgi:hypothetical protein